MLLTEFELNACVWANLEFYNDYKALYITIYVSFYV